MTKSCDCHVTTVLQHPPNRASKSLPSKVYARARRAYGLAYWGSSESAGEGQGGAVVKGRGGAVGKGRGGAVVKGRGGTVGKGRGGAVVKGRGGAVVMATVTHPRKCGPRRIECTRPVSLCPSLPEQTARRLQLCSGGTQPSPWVCQLDTPSEPGKGRGGEERGQGKGRERGSGEKHGTEGQGAVFPFVTSNVV